MAKTQTITFKKAGTSWTILEDAQDAMAAAIDATAFSTDALLTSAQSTPISEASLDGQLYTEVRIFTDDEYATYKSNISSLETNVENALVADGWEITDTVE